MRRLRQVPFSTRFGARLAVSAYGNVREWQGGDLNGTEQGIRALAAGFPGCVCQGRDGQARLWLRLRTMRLVWDWMRLSWIR
jgi:hypothetical protein